jgi:hypothetical protein
MSAWPDDTSEHGIGAPDPSRVGGASAFSGILAQMQAEIHPAPYHQYIEPLQEAGIQGGRLVLVGSPRVVVRTDPACRAAAVAGSSRTTAGVPTLASSPRTGTTRTLGVDQTDR